MLTYAIKTFDQLSISEVLKKIRVVFNRISIINKDLTVLKITIIKDIKTSKISTITMKYINIQF